MNYYPFHLGDYAAHTKHLGLLEDLAYRRMIDLYYTTEKPLPNAVSVANLGCAGNNLQVFNLSYRVKLDAGKDSALGYR